MIWLAITALGVVSFLFAGMEAGLLSINAAQLRHHVKQKTGGARRLESLLEHPERLLVTVLLVTNVADILALLLATRELVGGFGRVGYAIVITAAIPIYLFLLGVLPKALFRRLPFRALSAMGGILETASLVLSPVLAIGRRVGRFLRPEPGSKRRRLFAAREELKQVAAQSEREGSLSSTERAMIHNVVDFRNVSVRDVMVPLANCVSVQPGTPVEKVLELSRSSGLERIPVISPEGHAVGLINVLEILVDQSRADTLARYTRRIVTASDTEPAYRIIRRLRAARLGLAAVVDSQRRLLGIATDEELVKRLVQSA